MVRRIFSIALLFAFAAGPLLSAQTFEVNQPSQSKPKKGKKAPVAEQPQSDNSNGIGWGSGIETAREARAVQQAMREVDDAIRQDSRTRRA